MKRATDGAHFVECGTYAGKSAAFMGVEIANSGKSIRFDCCDTFQGVDRKHFDSDRDFLDQEALRGDDGTLAATTRANLAPVADYIHLRVGDSLSLATTYPDASLDFVFLDDDHSTDHVLRELAAWSPKVKPGGMLAGHDLTWPSVRDAVTPWALMAGLELCAVSASSWAIVKPAVTVAGSLHTPVGARKCLVAVCCNERMVYRQTVASLLNIGWGQRVTAAATRHGFSDIQFAFVNTFLLVSDLRNEAVRIAQTQGCTHILFLDADMTWPATVLDQMLAHHDQGIVSGLYFLKTWPHWPVALKRGRVNPLTGGVDYDYDKQGVFVDGLVPQQMVGMGCTLIPMAVFTAMPAPWFEYRQDPEGHWTVTEDVPFCQKAAALGCPIAVDMRVKCGHISQHGISQPWYERSLVEIAMLEQKQQEGVA